jgi:hypothetical protein
MNSTDSVVTTEPSEVEQSAGAPDISDWYPWFRLQVYLFIGIGFVLNVIVAAAYIKSTLLTNGKPAHQLIFNVVLTDLAICVLSQPYIYFMNSTTGIRYAATREMTCLAGISGTFIGFDSTLSALFLISAERLFAISAPLEHMHRLTRKKCRVVIVISWVLVIVKNVIPFFWNQWQPYRPCNAVTAFTDAYAKYVYNVCLYGMMGAIVVLNIFLGIMVINAKRKASKMMSISSQNSMKIKIGELKIVKIVFMVVSVLLATWIPNNVLGNVILDRMTKGQHVALSVLVTFHLSKRLPLIALIADPIIYFVNNNQCRDAVRDLFCSSNASSTKKEKVYAVGSGSQRSKTTGDTNIEMH